MSRGRRDSAPRGSRAHPCPGPISAEPIQGGRPGRAPRLRAGGQARLDRVGYGHRPPRRSVRAGAVRRARRGDRSLPSNERQSPTRHPAATATATGRCVPGSGTTTTRHRRAARRRALRRFRPRSRLPPQRRASGGGARIVRAPNSPGTTPRLAGIRCRRSLPRLKPPVEVARGVDDAPAQLEEGRSSAEDAELGKGACAEPEILGGLRSVELAMFAGLHACLSRCAGVRRGNAWHLCPKRPEWKGSNRSNQG